MTTDLIITTIEVSHFAQNARIIRCPQTQDTIIIDPGENATLLAKQANAETNPIHTIFLTHCHIDHGGAVQDLLNLLSKQPSPPELIYHSNEIPIANAIEPYAEALGLPPIYKNVPPATQWADSLSTLKVGNKTAKILFTPGHSPGHLSLYFDSLSVELQTSTSTESVTCPILIAGDALFRDSIGRTDLPLADHNTLLTSIKNQLFTLPESTLVLSGHGPTTTIGHEKKHNPFINE